MNRLTKAELVNGFPVCYPKNNSGVGEIVMKNYPYREIVEKLKHYEDLEEKLISVYGECDGLLELAVEKLAEYGEHQFGKSYRSRLLTDEDADMWVRWKELKRQGRLKELPCKVNDAAFRISRGFKISIRQMDVVEICLINIGADVMTQIKCRDCTDGSKFHYLCDDIGENVFFTYKEAEDAMKSMNK